VKKFLVGGAVRDKLMGKTPKDFDYSVVLTQEDLLELDLMNNNIRPGAKVGPTIDLFTFMVHKLRREGFRTFVITPEHATVRAQFPKSSGQRLSADFVLARKEGPYSDGRRPDWVSPGTLEDDLARRDFTMNAIAQDEFGNFIDPFDGQRDMAKGVIRAVGNAKDRMMEDSLRVLRALRFRVQLGFLFDMDMAIVMQDPDVLGALRDNVSDERKMDELNKMFKVDAIAAMSALNDFKGVRDAVFAGKVKLMAHMKEKF